MDIQYFKSAWGDIKNSPGWFGRVCLLALVNFIPIFGQIVTAGYLYGWAREIAWGAHEPMPRKLIANEDGKFWRRGWFVVVLTFVFMLVPYIVISIGDSLQGLGIASTFFEQRYVSSPAWVGFGSLVRVIGAVLLVLAGVLAWIGNMRIAIYDRLSAGFQLGKIWKMLRHDTGGIVRIFGMELLFSFILGIVLSIVLFILIALVIAVGVSGLISAGYSIDALQYMTQAQALRVAAQFFASAGFVGVLVLLIGGFITVAATVFVEMLVVRALGYWTMQFEVALWDGQDDPMPFELVDKEPSPYYSQQPQPPAQPQAQSQAQAQPQPQPQQASAGVPLVAPLPVDASAPDAEDGAQKVEYDKPAVVGAGFIMTPEEIDEAEAEVQAQAADALAAGGAKAADDGGIGEYHVRYEASMPGLFGSDATSDAQGAHGVQDGEARDSHIGEDGEPHVGEPEGGQRQY